MSSFKTMLQVVVMTGVIVSASRLTATPPSPKAMLEIVEIVSASRLTATPPPLPEGYLSSFASFRKSAVSWEKSLKAAHQHAKQTNKPILILFEASWCRYCKKLNTQTISHPKMASYINKTFIPVRLDLDRDKQIAKILGVKKIPCTIILTPEGDMLSKQVGFEKPVTYYDKIAKARELQDKVHQVKYSRFSR